MSDSEGAVLRAAVADPRIRFAVRSLKSDPEVGQTPSTASQCASAVDRPASRLLCCTSFEWFDFVEKSPRPLQILPLKASSPDESRKGKLRSSVDAEDVVAALRSPFVDVQYPDTNPSEKSIGTERRWVDVGDT